MMTTAIPIQENSRENRLAVLRQRWEENSDDLWEGLNNLIAELPNSYTREYDLILIGEYREIIREMLMAPTEEDEEEDLIPDEPDDPVEMMEAFDLYDASV